MKDVQEIAILLIEDNHSDAQMVQKYLKKSDFYKSHVVRVNTIEEAQRVLHSQNFQVILVDISTSKNQAVENLRTLHENKNIPIIVITSDTEDDQNTLRAVQSGAQDFIVKESLTPGLLWQIIRYTLERYRLHEELRTNEQRMRTLLDTMDLFAVGIEADGTIFYINDQFLRITNYSRKETIGKNWFNQFITEKDKKNIQNIHTKNLENWEYAHFTNDILTKEKEIRKVNWNNTLVRNPDQSIYGIISIGVDITEELQTRELLNQQVFVNASLVDASNRLISVSTSKESIASIILRHALEITGSMDGYISILDPHKEMIFLLCETHSSGNTNSFTLELKADDHQIMYNLWQLDDNFNQVHFSNQPSFIDSSKSLRSSLPITNYLVYPSYLDDQYIGKIVLANKNGGYREYDIENIRRLSDLFTISATQTFDRDALEQRNADIELLYKASKQISTSLDIEDIMTQLLEFLRNRMDISSMVVSSYDPAEKMIRAAFVYLQTSGVIDLKTLPDLPLNPDGEGTQSRAIINKESILIRDFQEYASTSKKAYFIDDDGHLQDHEKINSQKEEVIRSAIIVPIISENKSIGVVQVMSNALDAYSQTDLRMIESISPQVGAAMKNAQLYRQANKEIRMRKITEQKLKVYSDNLEEMVAERTRALKEAQSALVRKEKLATLGHLAGGVAHELRNPLGVIKNSLYLIENTKDIDPEKLSDYLDLIEGEVNKSQYIITSLLDYAHPKTPARVSTPVQTVIEHALQRVRIPAAVKLDIDIGDALPKVFIDDRQMENVFENLLRNALQAMPDGGDLSIRAESEESHVRVRVTDTGHGIEPQDLEKLFQPLFSTKSRGIGLGLTISKLFVEKNNGTILVESDPGEGATFTITLPTA